MKSFGKLFLLILFVFISGIALATYTWISMTPTGQGSITITSAAPGGSSSSGSTGTSTGGSGSSSTGGTGATAQEKITMVFAGDVMLAGRVQTSVMTNGRGDYTYPWQNVGSYLREADIAFINLESVISDQGTVNLSKSAPRYRANPLAMTGLLFAGIDVVSLANDHVFDYGRLAMEDCIKRLRLAGISCIGAGLNYNEAYLPLYREVKGKKIAFIAFTNKGSSSWKAQKATVSSTGVVIRPGCSGVSWISVAELENAIFRARADKADLIVVSLHTGSDYSKTPNADQDVFAHLAMDRGADIVVGHSPNVTQPTVIYDRGFLSYSLGNLIHEQLEYTYANRGVTKGKVLEVVWENGGFSSARERATTISMVTWQPSFN